MEHAPIPSQARRRGSATMPQTSKSAANLPTMTPLRLLHFTDLHLTADETALLRGQRTAATLRQTLAQALAQTQASGWHPDAVVVTGDVVHDDPRAYELFRREFAALGLPVCCIPGNHDDAAPCRL